MVSQGDGEIGVNKLVTEMLDLVTKVYTSVDSLSNSIASSGNDPPSVCLKFKK